MDIFNSMSTMRTHATFKNNFVSILDKHDPKKIKNFTRESKTQFQLEPSRANNDQIKSQKRLFSSSSDKQTWWQI